MDPVMIFWPVLALMGWTFLMLALIPYHRFKAGFAKQVSADDFRYGESDRVPTSIIVPNRIFMNLIEMPALFYILLIILFLTRNVDFLFLALAWIYVGLRIVHSLIYLTYNHVAHRFLVFAVSNLVVLAIWIRYIIILSNTASAVT